MTTRTPAQALAWTRKRGPIPDANAHPIGAAGWCKRECRTAYGVPSDGSDDAAEAFSRTQHRGKGQAPEGALHWWLGGRNGHGHVAIQDDTPSRIRSTDLPTSGRWGSVPLSTPASRWGLRYVGWSYDIDGVRVVPAPPRPPSRLANLRARLRAVAADKSVGALRRRRALQAANVLVGLK